VPDRSSVQRPTIIEARRKTRLLWQRHGRLLSALLGAVSVALLARLAYQATRSEATISGALLVLCLAITQLAVRYYAPGVKLPSTAHNVPATSGPVGDAEQLFSASAEAIARYSPQQLSLLAELLLHPVAFRSRAVETVALTRRVTTRTTTVAFALLPDRSRVEGLRTLLVPVLVPKKGRLYDNSTVVDEEGRTVPTLAQREVQEVTGALLLSNFRDVSGLPANPLDWLYEQGKTALKLLESTILASAALVSVQGEAVLRKQIDTCLVSLSLRNHPQFPQLRDIAHLLLSQYLVLAEVPLRTRMTLVTRYEMTTHSLYTANTHDSRLALTRLVQEALDLPSGLVKIPLAHARNAQSYHLYVSVPEGSYLGLCGLFAREDGRPLMANPRPQTTRTVPYLRPFSCRGSNLHVYGRGLVSLPESDVRLRVYERPSGSELLGALAALAVAVLSLALRVASANPKTSTDIATVSLTLPVAIVTVAVLFQPVAKRSLLMSTAGVLAAGISSLTAAIFIAVFAIDVATREDNKTHFTRFWRFGVTESATFAGLCLAVLLLRTLRYRASRRGY